MRKKPGPKVDANVGPLSRRTVLLDDRTVALASVLGKNLSDGLRKAVKTAYGVYQRTKG